jgi:AraC-like DNA-binding protein
LINEAPSELQGGDILVFPQGDEHVLASAPGLSGERVHVDWDPTTRQTLPLTVKLGGKSGPAVHLICGFLGCDTRPFNPLLSTLPRKIHMAGVAKQHPQLAQFLALALAESRSPTAGRECVLARLSELMFIEIVRRYVATVPPERTGWLAGLSDELVGKALSTLHERPAEDWSLDGLAKDVATSRSVLAERFATLVGMPPMQYLTQWRMQLASELLTSTQATLAEIAERVGYGSEAAFSRAFKRLVGVSPAHWREGRRSHRRPGSRREVER